MDALARSRLEVSQALESASNKFPLVGRPDDILGPLAHITLCHSAAAYELLGDTHRQTHLLLAALSLRADTEPATFTTPMPSIACIPDGATFLRRLEGMYHDLLWTTASPTTSPRPIPLPVSIGVLEYAALGLGQQMTLSLLTSMSLADEASRYRHFASLLLEIGAGIAAQSNQPKVVIRDLATAIIVDTSEGNFAPLARVRLEQLADLTDYFASTASRYSLAHDLDFLFRPAA